MMEVGATLSLAGSFMLAHPMGLASQSFFSMDLGGLVSDRFEQFPVELSQFTTHLSKQGVSPKTVEELSQQADRLKQLVDGEIHPKPISQLFRGIEDVGGCLRGISNEPYFLASERMIASSKLVFPAPGDFHFKVKGDRWHYHNPFNVFLAAITAFILIPTLSFLLEPVHNEGDLWHALGDCLEIHSYPRLARRAYWNAGPAWMKHARYLFENGKEGGDTDLAIQRSVQKARGVFQLLGEAQLEDVVL